VGYHVDLRHGTSMC